jgi:hypothetical protein
MLDILTFISTAARKMTMCSFDYSNLEGRGDDNVQWME